MPELLKIFLISVCIYLAWRLGYHAGIHAVDVDTIKALKEGIAGILDHQARAVSAIEEAVKSHQKQSQ